MRISAKNQHKKIRKEDVMYTIVLNSDELKKKEAIDNLKILKGANMAHRRYGTIR